MSLPRVISELVVTGIRVLGKATAAAGAQAVRNFKHKPEGAPSAGPVGTGSSKSQITNALQMSVEEARLILNVKKDDPMEIIQKHYDSIFAANGPPPPAAEGAAKPAQAGPSRRPPPKGPVHSHYLQSKVFRALERIKAERGELEGASEAAAEAGAEGPAASAAGAAKGEAAGAAGSSAGPSGNQKPGPVPPEGTTFTPPPPPGSS